MYTCLGSSPHIYAVFLFYLYAVMANVKFLTWNVRGLRDKVKRSAIFRLKTYRADIVVLVEMHYWTTPACIHGLDGRIMPPTLLLPEGSRF